MTNVLRLSLSTAILAGLLLATGGAYAGGGSHGPHFNRLVQAPAAYDPFWKLKNPGGPVEANGLRSAMAPTNPQPEPPTFPGGEPPIKPGDLL